MSQLLLTSLASLVVAVVTALAAPWVARRWRRADENVEGTIKFQAQLLDRVKYLEAQMRDMQRELAERTERYQRLYTEHEILKRENQELRFRIGTLELDLEAQRASGNSNLQ